MGYYTTFTITILTEDKIVEKIIAELEDCVGGTFNESDDNSYFVDAKWYDFHTDLQTISARYPDVVIQVDGTGEEQGDNWRMYFKGGKYQNAKSLGFEAFNIEKLV